MSEEQLKTENINLEVSELPIHFSFFDLYSWWFFWSYKKYLVKFMIDCETGYFYRLQECVALPKPQMYGGGKDEWWLLTHFTKEENITSPPLNHVTLTIPCSKTCERINFIAIPNPPKSVAIAIKTES